MCKDGRLWTVRPCNLVGRYKQFQWASFLHLEDRGQTSSILKTLVQAYCFCNTLLPVHRAKQRNIPADIRLQSSTPQRRQIFFVFSSWHSRHRFGHLTHKHVDWFLCCTQMLTVEFWISELTAQNNGRTLADLVCSMGYHHLSDWLTDWLTDAMEQSPCREANTSTRGSLSSRHGVFWGCGWRNGLQSRRVAENILNEQLRTADKGWSSSLGVGRGANNSLP